MRLSVANAHTVGVQCRQRSPSGSLTLIEVRWFANACRVLAETIMLAECSQRFSDSLTLTEVQWLVNARRVLAEVQWLANARRVLAEVQCASSA